MLSLFSINNYKEWNPDPDLDAGGVQQHWLWNPNMLFQQRLPGMEGRVVRSTSQEWRGTNTNGP